MAINFKKYVKIVSGVGGAAAASRRDLGLRVFTANPVLAYNQVVVCTTADDVMALFGSKSAEYAVAAGYFGYISKSITQAKQISFARWLKDAPIYMTRLTAANQPDELKTFTGTLGLNVKNGEGGVGNQVVVTAEIGDGEVAADYEIVAELLTKDLAAKANAYAWLKGASCEFSGGVFKLEFTNNEEGASAGPSISLDALDQEGVTDARTIMGLRNYNAWDASKWSVFLGDGATSDWAAQHDYFVGDYVKNESKTYCCKTAHKSGSTFTASKWVELKTWAASTSYAIGDYVLYNGVGYKASSAHTSETTWDETKWESAAYDDSAAYAVGTFAFQNGVTYCNISAIAAPTGENPITESDITVPAETPVTAVSRVNGIDDNFGSFMFAEALGANQMKTIAAWNKGQNYKYVFLTYALRDSDANAGYSTVSAALDGCECTAVTYESRHDEFAEFMPAALFASTDYTRVNSTKTFMYKQFAGVNPSVGLKSDPSPAGNYANLYQDLDSKRINYYGQTMKSGKPLSFYQDGNCMDGTEISVACNEIWLKDAIETEIINLLLAMEKVPANANGVEMINMIINGVITEALNNGTISKDKTLTEAQKVYIDTTAGEKDAWKSVFTNGFWLNTVLKQDASSGSTVYRADYTLIYSKGDAIRKVTGSDIMI